MIGGRPIRPASPLIRPTSRSMSSRSSRYCSTRSLDGVATCMKTASSGSTVPSVDQLPEGADPLRQTLGVVQPVHTQEDRPGIAQIRPDLPRSRGRGLRHRQLVHALGVDRDRVRPREDRPSVRRADTIPARLVAEPLPYQPDEVLGPARQLEPDQVGAQQSLQDLAAPGQLLEQLGRRERDVQEEADPQVGTELAQHLGNQLELVVLHPDQPTLVGHPRRRPRRSAG